MAKPAAQLYLNTSTRSDLRTTNPATLKQEMHSPISHVRLRNISYELLSLLQTLLLFIRVQGMSIYLHIAHPPPPTT